MHFLLSAVIIVIDIIIIALIYVCQLEKQCYFNFLYFLSPALYPNMWSVLEAVHCVLRRKSTLYCSGRILYRYLLSDIC